jgi:hypothetical protein
MRIFLYGTLLDPRVLAARSGDASLARRAVPATLPGYRRVALRGTRYPTLVRASPGEAVRGVLVRADGAALGRLAAYEGPFYRLAPVCVVTPRGPRHARAWLAAAWRADAASRWEPPRPRRGRAAGPGGPRPG